MKKRNTLVFSIIILVGFCALLSFSAFAVFFILDNTPPTGTPLTLVSIQGEEIPPHLFVADVQDSSKVFASYESKPDFGAIGTQEVVILLTDAHHNETKLLTTLTVVEGTTTLTIEAGSEPEGITSASFVFPPNHIEAELLFAVNTLELTMAGVTHEVQVRLYSRIITCFLVVVDTTPPTAVPVPLDVWAGDTVEPMDFLSELVDYSPCTAEYKTEPDFTSLGETTVEILVTDAHGNEASFTSTAHVQLDTAPPVIEGAADQTILLGEKVNYRKGVAVTDNRDVEIALEIDAKEVNVNLAGSYPVYYSAVDSSGNTATTTITITVLAVDETTVNNMADAILADITNDSMTQKEKAKSIYNWVVNNVRYVSTGDITNVMQGAYNAFKIRRGDCFTFYAAAEVLLTRAGIQNKGVTRVPSSTKHYWNIINLGDGWYHFDTCPPPISTPFSTFMFTETQAQAYTAQMGDWWSYYRYDASLYPEVVS